MYIPHISNVSVLYCISMKKDYDKRIQKNQQNESLQLRRKHYWQLETILISHFIRYLDTKCMNKMNAMNRLSSWNTDTVGSSSLLLVHGSHKQTHTHIYITHVHVHPYQHTLSLTSTSTHGRFLSLSFSLSLARIFNSLNVEFSQLMVMYDCSRKLMMMVISLVEKRGIAAISE